MANYNKNYSYLLSSYAIKKVFLKRLRELRLSLFELVSIFGDEQIHLKTYLLGRKTTSHDNLCEEQLIKYLEFMGVEVKILLNVISENDPRYKDLVSEVRKAKKQVRLNQVKLENQIAGYKANLEMLEAPKSTGKNKKQQQEEKMRILKLRRELLIAQRKQQNGIS